MKRYRLLSLLLILLIVVVAFKFAQTFRKNANPTDVGIAPKTEFKIVDKSLVEEVPYVNTGSKATIEGFYPQFKNVNPSFNDKIRNSIVIAQAEFQDTIKDSDRISEMYFSTRAEYFQINEDVVSVLITIEQFTGGAHGFDVIQSYNYDVKKGREVALSDFFPNDPNYLKTLSDFSRKELLSKFQNDLRRADFDDDTSYNEALSNMKRMMQDGTEPREENFSVFTYTPEFLHIHFAEYQVAPYAYGRQTIKMPLVR